jgi:hypothetical protein
MKKLVLFLFIFILFTKISAEIVYLKKSSLSYLLSGLDGTYSSFIVPAPHRELNGTIVYTGYLKALTKFERKEYINLLKKGFDPETEHYRYRASFEYSEEYAGLYIDRVIQQPKTTEIIDVACYEDLQYPKAKKVVMQYYFYKWDKYNILLLSNYEKTKFISVKIVDINKCKVDINVIVPVQPSKLK